MVLRSSVVISAIVLSFKDKRHKNRRFSVSLMISQFFGNFCRYPIAAPAAHIATRSPHSGHALFAVRIEMGTKIHGKTPTVQH